MSTPNPIPSPLPGGVPVTAHNVLMLLASDLLHTVAGPFSQALAAVAAVKATPGATPESILGAAQGAMLGAGAQLVQNGVLTFEQVLTQVAQLGGYGLVKLEAKLPVAS